MRRVVGLRLVGTRRRSFALPQGAVVLGVDATGRAEATVWVLGDDANPTEARDFGMVPTGRAIPGAVTIVGHVGTVLFRRQDQRKAMHVFEVQ